MNPEFYEEAEKKNGESRIIELERANAILNDRVNMLNADKTNLIKSMESLKHSADYASEENARLEEENKRLKEEIKQFERVKKIIKAALS